MSADGLGTVWGRPVDSQGTEDGRWGGAGRLGTAGVVLPTRSGTAPAAARWAITGPSTSPQALLLFRGSLALQANNTKTLGKGREVD
jgi:hypothetical protein